MREGWRISKLGTLLDIQNGYAFNSKQFSSDGDMPLIRIRDLKSGTTTETRYSGAYDKKYIVLAGDFLIGMDGEFSCREWKGDDALLNQRVCRLEEFSPELYPRFIFYGINKYLKEIEDVTAYATVKHISAKQIRDIEFPIPSFDEQRRIVAILDEAFEGIGQAVANAEKNLANACELFESYLNSVFTQKGEGWVERYLKDICTEFGRGKSKHRPRNDPNLYGGPYPFIQTGDLSNASHVIESYTQTYSDIGLEQSKLWPKGTICLAIVGATIGETGVLSFDACFPDSVIGMVVEPSKADAEFLEYLLQHFKKRIKGKGKGSARANINLGTFDNQTFPIPLIYEQKKIVAKIDRLFNETKCLEAIYQQKLASLAALKQSLLQKAFAGELTVEAQIAIKEEAVA